MNITLNKLTFRYCSLPVGRTDAEGDRREYRRELLVSPLVDPSKQEAKHVQGRPVC